MKTFLIILSAFLFSCVTKNYVTNNYYQQAKLGEGNAIAVPALPAIITQSVGTFDVQKWVKDLEQKVKTLNYGSGTLILDSAQASEFDKYNNYPYSTTAELRHYPFYNNK